MPENRGLIGLTANTGKREQAGRDMDTLGKMLLLKKTEEQEEQQAQLIEEQYYDRIRQQADLLLAGDRKAINDKAKGLQADVKAKIKLFGGSKKKFMAAGGLSIISSYTNGILNSNELQTYKQNRINLERILDIKEKKLGHLLSEPDQKALDEYNKNGTGTVTYGGLLNEIVMPDKDTIEFGHVTTPGEILGYDSNRIKIMANYLLENPNKDEQWIIDHPGTLESYVEYKGYSARGNKVLSTTSTSTTSQNAKSNIQYSVAGSFATVLDYQKQGGVSVSNIKADTFEVAGYMDSTIGNNFESQWKYRAQGNQSVGDAILDIFKDGNDGWTMRGGRKIPSQIDIGLFQTATGGPEAYTLDGREVLDFDISNSSDIYTANGVPLEDNVNFGTLLNFSSLGGTAIAKALIDKAATSNKVKIVSSGFGWEARTNDGKSRLIVDALDDDGKFDQKRTDDLYSTDKGFDELKANPILFVMMEASDRLGHKENFYLKVPYTDAIHRANLKENLGTTDDLSKVRLEDVQNDNIMNYKKAQAEQTVRTEVKQSVNNVAFQRDLFSMQVGQYNTEPQGSKRANLMKAFYLMMNDETKIPIDDLIRDDVFKQEFEQNGLYAALTGGLNDINIFKKYINAENRKDPDPKQNEIVFLKTMNYLKELNNPKK